MVLGSLMLDATLHVCVKVHVCRYFIWQKKKYFYSSFSTAWLKIGSLIGIWMKFSEIISISAVAERKHRRIGRGKPMIVVVFSPTTFRCKVPKFTIRNSSNLFSFTSKIFNLISYRISIFKRNFFVVTPRFVPEMNSCLNDDCLKSSKGASPWNSSD